MESDAEIILAQVLWRVLIELSLHFDRVIKNRRGILGWFWVFGDFLQLEFDVAAVKGVEHRALG